MSMCCTVVRTHTTEEVRISPGCLDQALSDGLYSCIRTGIFATRFLISSPAQEKNMDGLLVSLTSIIRMSNFSESASYSCVQFTSVKVMRIFLNVTTERHEQLPQYWPHFDLLGAPHFQT